MAIDYTRKEEMKNGCNMGESKTNIIAKSVGMWKEENKPETNRMANTRVKGKDKIEYTRLSNAT